MAYENLAALYDGLMTETDYTKWAQYLDDLFKKAQAPGKKLLDLGCGTGNISLPLAEMGYQVTGVDVSSAMLQEAAAKSSAQNIAIQFIEADITQLDIEAFDCAIATFDTFNYILEEENLQFLLQNLAMGLNDGGVLIFDINTPFKLQNVLGDNIFTYHDETVDYIWENQFDTESGILQMKLTFFVKDSISGLYKKRQEYHEQRLYEPLLLEMWLQLAGFSVLGIYNQLESAPSADLEEAHKIVFVAKKAY